MTQDPGAFMAQLLDDYQSLQRECGQQGPASSDPALRLVHLQIGEPILLTADCIEAAIAPYCARWIGWVRYQSAVRRCPIVSVPTPADGLPLIGEWVNPDHPGQSVHLRYQRDDWHLVAITEHAEALCDTVLVLCQTGDDVSPLARITDLKPDERAIERLAYAVYWRGRHNDPAALHRSLARFCGFLPPQSR